MNYDCGNVVPSLPSGVAFRSACFFMCEALVDLMPQEAFDRIEIQALCDHTHGPHRLVVRTSRCGRDNPGSTPGAVICGADS